MDHRSVNRRTAQSSYRPATQPGGAGFSRSRAASGNEGNRTFAQDFNMEHSLSGATVTIKKAFTASKAAETSPSRSTDPMNLPSCVYLG